MGKGTKETRGRVRVEIPAELYEKLRTLAAAQGCSVDELANSLLCEYLRECRRLIP